MAKVPFSLKIEDKILKEIRLQAEKEHRPVNNFIEVVLIKYLEGIGKEKQKNPGE